MEKINVQLVKPLLCFDIKDWNYFCKKTDKQIRLNYFIRYVIQEKKPKTLLECVDFCNHFFSNMVIHYFENL